MIQKTLRKNEMNETPKQFEDQRIAEQRKLKRDTTLPQKPLFDNLYQYLDTVTKVHLGFIAIWFLLTTAYAAAGEKFVNFFSPLADLVFYIWPNARLESEYFGSLGATFYRSITGETFFVAIVLAILTGGVYVGRYWSRPWRMSQFVLEQLGTKASWLAAVVMLAVVSGLAALLGLTSAAWLGFISYGDALKPIALFQLAMWSILASGSAFGLLFCCLLAVSTFLFIIKKFAVSVGTVVP
jgi:hypothetical protein